MRERNMSARQVEAAVQFAVACEDAGIARARDIIVVSLRYVCNHVGERAKENAADELYDFVMSLEGDNERQAAT